jgi:Fe-S cluster biogenesis protein NfuA
MTKYDSTLDRDGNYQTIGAGLPFLASKRITFDGGTANGIGNDGGTQDPFTIFDVTGDVMLYVFGVCKTTLVGAATIEVGVTGNTAVLIPQVADATSIAVNEGWHDATSILAEGFTPQIHIVGGGLDVICTITTTNITAGVIDFYCQWRPLSSDGLVAAH